MTWIPAGIAVLSAIGAVVCAALTAREARLARRIRQGDPAARAIVQRRTR